MTVEEKTRRDGKQKAPLCFKQKQMAEDKGKGWEGPEVHGRRFSWKHCVADIFKW